MLFECLAGRPPFQGQCVGEVLRQHMTVQPPELRRLGLPVPRVLDEVIQRLLRKDPRDRYQTAAAVVADLTVIAEALQHGESEPALVVGLHDRRQTLTEPAFVGRGQELAALNAQLKRTQAGQGGVVLLEAESGGGKSRLLAEFAQRGVQQDAWVLRGQGLDQAAQRPFQLLTGVAEGILATARLESGIGESIRAGLGDHLSAVCSALPELAALFGSSATGRLGPETFVEARSVQALAALLDALGTTGRPVSVLLDDCQWADQLTLKVLSNWQRRTATAGRPILLVAAFRSEEVPANHSLRKLRSVAHLTLPAFQAAHVRKLVESMAGPLPDEAMNVIERLAEGSPFMASAALRGLVESGALVAMPTGWRVESLAMADVQSSRHAAAFQLLRGERCLLLKLLVSPPRPKAGLVDGWIFGRLPSTRRCPMHKKYIVRLSDGERVVCQDVVQRLKGTSEKVKRAQMLLKADADGPAWIDARIAEAFDCRVQTVESLRKRLVTQGFEQALERKRRATSPTPRKLDGVAEAKLIAMRLGKPPAGYGRWSLQLLADELVVLEVVDSICPETVRKTLKKTG